MKQTDTKTRILNAAEKLFAKEGFHHTSMRTITSTAKANLAAVNYHFGSKESLLCAVIERRLIPLNLERNQRLHAVLDAAREARLRPDTTSVLRAFIEPTLAFREGGEGNRSFISLIGRSMSEPDSTVRDHFIRLIDPVFRLLISSLQESLPDLPPAVLQTRLLFFIGAMGQTMCVPERSAHSPEPPFPVLSTAELSEELIRFIRAGLEAPC